MKTGLKIAYLTPKKNIKISGVPALKIVSSKRDLSPDVPDAVSLNKSDHSLKQNASRLDIKLATSPSKDLVLDSYLADRPSQ